MKSTKSMYEKIFRCPHNKSKAKMLYTFAKAERFGLKQKIL